jgi:cytochrome c oxidase assembly factor CtaG
MNSHNPFPRYREMAPTGSTATSILANVHLGGAIMWIGGDALMLLACIPIAVAWVKWETVRTRELDAELDRQGL